MEIKGQFAFLGLSSKGARKNTGEGRNLGG
jgi:hypothetical protein